MESALDGLSLLREGRPAAIGLESERRCALVGVTGSNDVLWRDFSGWSISGGDFGTWGAKLVGLDAKGAPGFPGLLLPVMTDGDGALSFKAECSTLLAF